MVGFEQIKGELDKLDARVIAASVDDAEHAAEVAAELSFPVAYGVTREQARALDSWWEDRRSIIQPSEFIIDGDGTVLAATYSTGPVGRMGAEDAVRYITMLESRKAQQG